LWTMMTRLRLHQQLASRRQKLLPRTWMMYC
jgi:hypothetical protein